MRHDDMTQSGPVRLHRSREGLAVVADLPRPSFAGAFRVRQSGAASVRVGLGTIEQIIPTLRGVPLDGKDAKGNDVRVPDLELDEGPNDELRSWVFLQVRVYPESGLLMGVDAGEDDAPQVVHGNDLKARYQNGFSRDDGEGRGWLPLAMLVWGEDERTVQRVIQNVYFHQRHTWRPATAQQSAAYHFFYPAA